MGRAQRPGFLPRVVAAAGALLAAIPAFAESTHELTVSTGAELLTALASESRARTIRLRAGRYMLDAPLSIPDDVELAGEGVMRLDADGIAMGFAAGTETALVARPGFRGDVLTLGDGAVLRGLRIEGPALDAPHDGAADGNVVLIASRRAGDRLRATLRDCEIVNHGSFGAGPGSPTGRAIVVMTRNPGGGVAWHEGAQVATSIERSIVRNEFDSNAVFAINFAGDGAVALELERNRFEGVLMVVGAAGRPDKVTGARATLRSRDNVYVSAGGPYPAGWFIIGGSVGPHDPLTQGAEANSVHVDSQGDRIEGYRIGILAAAGRLIHGLPGRVANNRGELLLRDLRITTVGDEAADLSLHGAFLESRPDPASASTVNGAEGNVLRVTLHDSIGSGHRQNVYAHGSPTDLAATGAAQRPDRLEFTGSQAQFLESNPGFSPVPDSRLFLTGDDDR